MIPARFSPRALCLTSLFSIHGPSWTHVLLARVVARLNPDRAPRRSLGRLEGILVAVRRVVGAKRSIAGRPRCHLTATFAEHD